MKKVFLILGLILIPSMVFGATLKTPYVEVNPDTVNVVCPSITNNEEHGIIVLNCYKELEDGSRGDALTFSFQDEAEEKGRAPEIKDGNPVLIDNDGNTVTEIDEEGEKKIYLIDEDGKLLLDENLEKKPGVGVAHFKYVEIVTKEANPIYQNCLTDGEPDKTKIKAELDKKLTEQKQVLEEAEAVK